MRDDSKDSFDIVCITFEALAKKIDDLAALHGVDGSPETLAPIERAKALALRGASLARQLHEQSSLSPDQDNSGPKPMYVRPAQRM